MLQVRLPEALDLGPAAAHLPPRSSRLPRQISNRVLGSRHPDLHPAMVLGAPCGCSGTVDEPTKIFQPSARKTLSEGTGCDSRRMAVFRRRMQSRQVPFAEKVHI